MAGHHPPHRHSDKESLVNDDSVLGEMGMLFEGLYPTTIKGFLWESPCGIVGRSNLEAAAVAFPITSTLASRETETEPVEWDHRPRPIQSFVAVEKDCTAIVQTHKSQQNQTRETDAVGSIIGAVVRCIDDDPGALASGHYVWPASLALCDFLVAESHLWCGRRMPIDWKPPHKRTISTNTSSRSSCSDQTTTTNNHNTIDDSQGNTIIRSVLELGAGSGIPSILASQLLGDTLHLVVVTDGDPTALERARENHQRTLAEIGTGKLGIFRKSTKDARNAVAEVGIASSALFSVRTEFHRLEWGSESDWKTLTEALNRDKEAEDSQSKLQPTQQHWPNSKQEQAPHTRSVSFDLVLGSDLIDCVDVVEPLFATVDRALKQKETIPKSYHLHQPTTRSRFLLSQSFWYDSETEAAIERACHRFALERRLWTPAAATVPAEQLQHDNPTNSNNITRIQEFQRRCDS